MELLIIICLGAIFFIIANSNSNSNNKKKITQIKNQISYDIENFYDSNFKNSKSYKNILDFDNYNIVNIDIKKLSLTIEEKYNHLGKNNFIKLYNYKKQNFTHIQNDFEKQPEIILSIYMEKKLEKEDFMKLKVYELLNILIMNYYIDYKKNGHSKELKNLLLYGAMFRVNKDYKKICFATEKNHSIPILEMINKK